MTLEHRDVKLVYVGDLEDLIRETYRRPYSIIACGLGGSPGEGNHQDTMIEVTVPHALDLDEDVHAEGDGGKYSDPWVRPTFEEWRNQPEPEWSPGTLQMRSWDRERDYACSLQPILNDLHERGEIEAGDYVIHIWW